MEIDLENAIVILDEAHNIEDAAREAGCLEVTLDDLEQAAAKFKDMADHDILTNSCMNLFRVRQQIFTVFG